MATGYDHSSDYGGPEPTWLGGFGIGLLGGVRWATTPR